MAGSRRLILPLGIEDNFGSGGGGYQFAARHPPDIRSLCMLADRFADYFVACNVHSYSAGIHQSIIGQCCDICDLAALVLVDRPVIFFFFLDLCPQTECILFGSHQFEIGTFHIPDQRNVRDQCADPITGNELFVERASQ